MTFIDYLQTEERQRDAQQGARSDANYAALRLHRTALSLGNEVLMEQIEENLDETENKNFFAKLKGGDFGLSTTYWLYGVGGSFFIRVILRTIGQTSAFMFLTLFAIATVYMGIVWLGIWRAADKFEGNEIWIVASKLMVAFGVLAHINNIFGFI